MGATALAAMLPFLYIEGATIAEFGRSWLTTQNIIDGLTYINQVGFHFILPSLVNPNTLCLCICAFSLH